MRLIAVVISRAALAASLFAVTANSSATLVFSENMGTPSGDTLIAAYSGWQSNGILTFSGTGNASVRSTSQSTGYPDASGSGNVLLSGSTITQSFQISSIDTSLFLPGTLDLSFGAFKSTNASTMSELSLGFSSDGLTFTPIAIPVQPSGSGTSNWRLLSFENTAIPIGTNIRLRWSNSAPTGGVGFRIDDVILQGDLAPVAIPEASSLILGGVISTSAALVVAGRRRFARRVA